MINTFTRQELGVTVACVLALGIFSGTAQAQDAKNTKNIACMQPDRHVFIEVSGTRLVK